jgi:hypothetical protein
MNRFSLILFVLFMLCSCKSEYDKLVRQELATGIRKDSLIFDMRIGETRKDFYTKCWDLNKQELISQGTGNQSVQYLEPLENLSDPTLRKEMLFYGIFDEKDILQGMDMVYRYTTWAPWNEERFAEVLLEDLKNKYATEYPGNNFIKIDLEASEYSAYVKVDGNRQILMYPINDKDVAVKIEDLNHKLNKKDEG